MLDGIIWPCLKSDYFYQNFQVKKAEAVFLHEILYLVSDLDRAMQNFAWPDHML